MNLADTLTRIGACREAIRWVEGLPARTSTKRAWTLCERGDWLEWLVVRLDIDRKLAVTARCRIARTVLHLVPAGEDRPRVAIETAEAWVRGDATEEQAHDAAYAAANAAYAAAFAAFVAFAFAAYAANTATYAAFAFAVNTARSKSLRESADTIREVIPWGMVRDALAALEEEA